MVRSFIATEITPYHEQWLRDSVVSRDVWLAAGQTGLLGIDVDEKYGCGENPDYRLYLILNVEGRNPQAPNAPATVCEARLSHKEGLAARPRPRCRRHPGRGLSSPSANAAYRVAPDA
jgi:alkylation response protein AidB-like acyl-CoA dehydrogenase